MSKVHELADSTMQLTQENSRLSTHLDSLRESFVKLQHKHNKCLDALAVVGDFLKELERATEQDYSVGQLLRFVQAHTFHCKVALLSATDDLSHEAALMAVLEEREASAVAKSQTREESNA